MKQMVGLLVLFAMTLGLLAGQAQAQQVPRDKIVDAVPVTQARHFIKHFTADKRYIKPWRVWLISKMEGNYLVVGHNEGKDYEPKAMFAVNQALSVTKLTTFSVANEGEVTHLTIDFQIKGFPKPTRFEVQFLPAEKSST